MSSDVLAVYRCGCRIVRDDGGCGVHIQWCPLHENAHELLRACMRSEQTVRNLALGSTMSETDKIIALNEVDNLSVSISRAGGCGQ